MRSDPSARRRWRRSVAVRGDPCPLRIETKKPRSIGGEPAAVARSAEWRGGGRDDAERSAVGKAEALGRRAGVLGGDGSDGAVASRQDLENLALRHDLLRGPSGGAADVHVLDEPDLGLVRPREFDQVDQFVLVNAPDYHGVELHAETGGAGCRD